MYFEIKAINPDGEVAVLVLEAVSDGEAVSQAQDQGYAVLAVRQRSFSWTWSRSGFQLALFTQELLALLEAIGARDLTFGAAAALVHGADAETPHAAQRHAHVELARLVQLLQALGRHDLGQQAARRIGRQQLVVDGDAFAVDLDQRRRVDRQVDVGRLLLAHQAQNPLHRAHVFPQIRVLSLFLDRCHALLT